MKYKINWGQGIFIFYVLFVVVVISTLYASTKIDHSLVTNDYYSQDLRYQAHFEKIQNEKRDRVCTIDDRSINKELILKFKTEGTISGTAHFYRPSDKSQDFNIEINQNKVTINTQAISKGKWILKVDWTCNNTSYYKEEQLFI